MVVDRDLHSPVIDDEGRIDMKGLFLPHDSFLLY